MPDVGSASQRYAGINRAGKQMTFEVDQTVLERFQLSRCISVSEARKLWECRDLKADKLVLAEFYSGPPSAELEDLQRHFAEIEHQGLLRSTGLHGDDSVSIVTYEHRIIRSVELDSARSYGQVARDLKHLTAAMHAVQSAGLQPGAIARQLVFTDDRAVLLLPPLTAATGSDNDITQLGDLAFRMLTGGARPDQTRDVNSRPDLLHGGRTVPAGLSNLIADMLAENVAQQPPGLRAVMARLDEVEKLVAMPLKTPRQADPSPEPEPQSAPARPLPNERSSPMIAILLGVIAAALLLIAWRLWQLPPEQPQNPPIAENPVTPEPPEQAPETGPDDTPQPPEPPVEDLAAKAKAEQQMDAYVKANRELTAIGGNEWGGDAYTQHAGVAEQADNLMIAKDYAAAGARYGEAEKGMHSVAGTRAEALRRLLEDGVAALKNGEAAEAARAFRLALMIDRGNPLAAAGQRRAGTLDLLNGLLKDAAVHEDAGRVAMALTDYTEAAELDPLSPEAVEGKTRTEKVLGDQRFQEMISAGLELYHAKRYDEARTKLLEAEAFRPKTKAVKDALEMVEDGVRLVRIKALMDEAAEREISEDWQAARKLYLEVLTVDRVLVPAIQGAKRCEQVIRLEENIGHYLKHPDEVLTEGGRAAASLLLGERDEVYPGANRLRDMFKKLNALVNAAQTPIKVTITSDSQTSIDIYKVARLGKVEQKELSILPGKYTVVGRRTGYRDVRTQLVVAPGAAAFTYNVICVDPIE
jgi:tetratricopeptide (TPR) repeat protein